MHVQISGDEMPPFQKDREEIARVVGYHGKSVISLAGVLNSEGTIDIFSGFARSLVTSMLMATPALTDFTVRLKLSLTALFVVETTRRV